jgi:molybdopterin synthase sulfur carrier subunit
MVAQKLKLKTFGVARDILGGSEVEVTAVKNVGELKSLLFNTYPKLKNLNSLLIAVNQSYAMDETPITDHDEVAVIPPVSGG